MSDKFEHWVAQNLPFLYAIVLSVWGGFVQYANKVRAGERWSWTSMLLDLVVCSFAGLIAFFACQAAGIKDWQAAIVIAVGGLALLTMLLVPHRIERADRREG